MDRNVFRTEPVEGVVADGKEPSPAEKLLKYFPAEALALYSTLDPLMRETWDPGEDALKVALWASLAISVVFCWLFLQRFWHVKLWQQLLISTGALVLYIAALGGPFSTIDDYKPIYGVIAAVIASAFLLFVRAPEKPA